MQTQHREALDLAITYLDSLASVKSQASGQVLKDGHTREEELMVKMNQHAQREIKTPLDLDKVVGNCLMRASEAQMAINALDDLIEQDTIMMKIRQNQVNEPSSLIYPNFEDL
jgi:hypothetical protein